MRQTSVASVSREQHGSSLTTAGRVFAWGDFNDNDQSNIALSIEDALVAAARERQVTMGEPVRIYVLIRKYLVRTSNSFVAVFSGIDWVAVNSRSEILFQDTFYATSYCEVPRICPVGSVKDEVSHAIVERISKRAIVLAMGLDPTSIVPDRTYSSFKDAEGSMQVAPRSSVTRALFGPRPGSDSEHVFWVRSAELDVQIDWGRRLKNASH